MHPEDIENLENPRPGERTVFRFLQESASLFFVVRSLIFMSGLWPDRMRSLSMFKAVKGIRRDNKSGLFRDLPPWG